jgi:cytochrome c biogenesis protein CcdA
LARVIGLVVVIALADSLNPSTIAPGLYIAAGQRPRYRVLQFTASVFLVHLAGGTILIIGPGQLLLSLVNDLGETSRRLLELGAGLAMTIAAIIIWRRRRRLAEKDLPDPNPKGRSSAILGATIMVVELPTAFPYFGAIAAILGAGGSLPSQVFALVIYNLCFVLPLIAILATLLFVGDDAEAALNRWRDRLQQRWPAVLALLLLGFGIVVIAFGATGL